MCYRWRLFASCCGLAHTSNLSRCMLTKHIYYQTLVDYHASATVVFDGYDGLPSTESAEENRRVRIRTSVDIIVKVTPNLPTITSQCAFLGHKDNACHSSFRHRDKRK